MPKAASSSNPKKRQLDPRFKCAWRKETSPPRSLARFVRKTVDRLDAFGERLNQRRAPSERREGRCVLIGLLVGLREELERGIGRRNKLPHCDEKFHVAAGLTLLHGEVMQQAQFLRRIVLCESPFERWHVLPSEL